jgi:FMN-dependent NADH-azoreductase
MNILRIDSATTGAQSVSRELTQAITDHLLAQNPGATLVSRDLESDPLPHLTTVTTGAIRLPAEAHDAAIAAAFAGERAVLDQFLAADVVIIGAPMYNFSIPSNLKSWLDRLGVPGVTFSYSEAGPKGLAGGRRVIIASAQGGMYEPGGPAEHQESLLKAFLGFIGIDAPEFIRVDKIGFGPEAKAASMAAAMAAIAAL